MVTDISVIVTTHLGRLRWLYFMSTQKAYKVRCVCDRKSLQNVANAINSKNVPLTIKDVQKEYRCCTKCKLCVPYLVKLSPLIC